MADREEQLDALASAENRRDTRTAAIITVVALLTVLAASVLVVFAGVHA